MATFYTTPHMDTPSFVTGYARAAYESEAPEQWEGLVAAWAPFLGVQGAVLYDIGGGQVLGTLENMTAATAWVTTARGLSLAFVGASSQAVGMAQAPVVALPYTMMCWVYATDGTTQQGLVGIGPTASTLDLAALMLSGHLGTVVTAASRTGTIQRANTTASYPLNTWFHAAGVWRSTTDRRAYLNGGSEGTNTVATDILPPTTAALGSRPVQPREHFFSGWMNDIRIYNRALEPAELVAIVSNPFALYRRWQRTLWAVPAVVGSTLPVKQWQYRQRRSA